MLGGASLKKLDALRTTYYVYIDWDSDKHAIRVTSERSQEDVASALKGVRQAFKNAEAEETYSKPLYIIVPPNENIMRTIVEPASTSNNDGTRGQPSGAKLAGDSLSREEKSAWKANIEQKLEKNQKGFEDRLSAVTRKLSHYMPWMRMRVHFGHICLEKHDAKFKTSEMSFKEFEKMMTHTKLIGTLDRK